VASVPRGEFELIAAFRERLDRAGAAAAPDLLVGSGDDASVSELTDRGLAVSVDALVEDVHFRRASFPPRSIGHKALAAALSDLAAMGARPRHAYVQLGLPTDLDDAQCLEIADGLAALAARHEVAVAGGDVTRAAILFLAVTVVGSAPEASELVGRNGARPGDLLVLSGELGGAAAGLRLLEQPALADRLDSATASALRARQLEPEPRVDAGRALARAGAQAMIDLSDGLGADAAHLAGAGGVELRIDLDRVPVQAGVAELARANGEQPAELVVAGGEDYELLAVLAGEAFESARAALVEAGVDLSAIGEVTVGEGVAFSGSGGLRSPVAGFDQLRPPRGRGERS